MSAQTVDSDTFEQDARANNLLIPTSKRCWQLNSINVIQLNMETNLATFGWLKNKMASN